jgi:hypothetical protein
VKNIKYFLFALFLSIVVIGCTTLISDKKQKFPVESFTQVQRTQIINLCTIVDGKQTCAFTPDLNHFLGPKIGNGSGVIVGNVNHQTLILTAAHVCSSQIDKIPDFKKFLENRYPQIKDIKLPEPIGKFENVKEIKIETSLFVSDLENNLHSVEIVDKNDSSDLCLLKSFSKIPYPSAAISYFPPVIGEEVFNTAAPLGIFKKGMVPLFSGYFAGLCDDKTYFCPKRASESYVYTGMVIAPGSSGSPVYRKIDGKFYLVSIIHSVHIHLPEIAYGTTFDQTMSFLKKSMAKAHVQVAAEKAEGATKSSIPDMGKQF